MTHEEVRELLPRYAAGVLSDASSDVVRAHLAEGCLDCLRDVFDRPVGLEAPAPPEVPPPPAVAPAPPVVTPPPPVVTPPPPVVTPPPPVVTPPPPVGGWLAPIAILLSLVFIAVAASMILVRPERGDVARDGGADVTGELAKVQELREALATERAAFERAAATAESASEAAAEVRSSMADVERELRSARLRIRSLKRTMRRQDLDFRQKEESLKAMIARLGGVRAPAAEQAGVATVSDRLVPCEETHLDVWSFAVRQGRRYTVTADTVEAASAADLCLAGSCRGLDPFSGNDEVPCRAGPGLRCPRATFVASGDATCVVAVTLCSPGCGTARAARYELRVEGAESLALVADDISSATGEINDAF